MRKSEVFLSVALLASLAASGWLWSELRAERSRNEVFSKSLIAPNLVASPAPPSNSFPPVTPAAPVPAPPTPTSTPAAAPTETPGAVAGTPEDWQRAQRRLMSDPRYREALRDQRRLTFSLRRDNIIRLVGLTPEQAAAVIDLQIDRELAYMEGTVTHRGDNLPVPPVEDRARVIERDHEDKLRALLGEQKYAGLQRYMESRASRMQVDTFRTQLAGADMLREDQVEPLVAALHVEQSRMHQDLSEYRDSLEWNASTTDSRQLYVERERELRAETHLRMHDAAASILSSSQLAKFDDLLRRDRERRETQERMQGLQAKIGGANAFPQDQD